jgi:uncharacterized protein YjbI with pentapeptide repeats
VIPFILAALAFAGIVMLVWLGYRRRWQWTGLPARKEDDGTRSAKTLWDWLQLLVVPLVLAIAAYALNASQAGRDRELQERQAAQERRLAVEETRERALNAYLDRISNLIMRGDLPDVGARSTLKPPSDAQTFGRTLTLVVLRRLDGGRKALVLQFLWEAGLIRQTQRWTKKGWPEWGFPSRSRLPIVSLENADLSGVDLSGNSFATTTTTTVGYPPEGISHLFRQGVDLTGADLRGADLSEADLSGASFLEADLRGAVFDRATLTAAIFDQACMAQTSFRDAVLAREQGVPAASLKYAGGHDVDFRGADLDHVGLQASRLEDVHLEDASTREASLPRSLEISDLPRFPYELANRCEPPRMR